MLGNYLPCNSNAVAARNFQIDGKTPLFHNHRIIMKANKFYPLMEIYSRAS